MLKRIGALLALLALAPVAGAQNVRPGFQNLRYLEDWSVLGEGVTHSDLLDPIRYIPFDEDERFWLGFGGQLRGRLEMWKNFDFGSSTPDSSDTYLLGRVRVHANLQLTEYFRLFAEFKGAYLTDRNLRGGRRPVDEDLAALQNGFGEIRLPFESFTVGAQGGRREMQYGAQRLVSPLDWANARRTFDGATGYVHGEGWRVDGFWTRPVRVRQTRFNESSNDARFYGIHGVLPAPSLLEVLELYWFGLHLDDARATNGTRGSVDRHTLGGRIQGKIPHTPLVAEIEGAAQLGSVRSADILAGNVATVLTWPFDVPLEPEVYLGYDWASGGGGNGGDVHTFDQLYPLGHAYLGFMDFIARQNVHALRGGAKFSPLAKSVVELTVHSFWLDTVEDALYNAGGVVLRLNPAARSNHVGVEMDFTIRYTFVRGLAALLGYSHFFTGDYLEDSPPDRDADFGYIELTWTF